MLRAGTLTVVPSTGGILGRIVKILCKEIKLSELSNKVIGWGEQRQSDN